MIRTKILVLTACALGLSACGGFDGGLSGNSPDKTIDRGTDRKHLSQLQAGIWIDPNGCDHWIIDDGVEGYLSARLDKRGKPVCSGAGVPTEVIGDFKGGSTVSDAI